MKHPPATAAQRLARLRLRITLLFTAMFLPALAVLAVVVVDVDEAARRRSLDDGLYRVSSAVTRLVDYTGGHVTFAGITPDEIDGQCPQFTVLPGGAPPFEPYRSKKTCVQADRRQLDPVAIAAVRGGRPVARSVTGPKGARLRVTAEPFWNGKGDAYGGAVLAVGDEGAVHAAHRRVLLAVTGGGLALLGLLAWAGHALSGRVMRPAVTALEQQEALLADAAHDLRTPLSTLRTLAETALADPSQRAELLPRTIRLAAGMGGIVEGLLTRARLASGVMPLDRRPLRLDQLVETALEELTGELTGGLTGPGHRVTSRLDPCVVSADPDLLRRAVGNLVGNALQHGHAPGRPAHVHVTVADGRLTVADQGPGIAPEAADRVFERFHSGSGSTGLGLAVTRWIAEAHGGSLVLTPAPPPGGATFTLTLPTEPPPAGPRR
ncbi:HAMP domain-containing sensor histidine kinase [Streptomyces sp. MST-110588]|uniref:sensor histidine kinase n=1 Tax=Streptomyces sp. MST-110588 TaxID=2833628 RepID=UPI001F5CA68D|nr:HAMP domain-containing sensor histidine kinase [Streptomyces sp. MST-110588]UNO38422.1 HAMP domain-containing histidine kinase [Streptomyces sp. MST-110588]